MPQLMLSTQSLHRSGLVDGDAEVGLIGPFAVVVWASTLRLALQATSMLFLGNATRVVKGDTCVLLCAWIVAHGHHAFLVVHDVWVRASSTGILLDGIEL